jgi:hypothetical protein
MQKQIGTTDKARTPPTNPSALLPCEGDAHVRSFIESAPSR